MEMKEIEKNNPLMLTDIVSYNLINLKVLSRSLILNRHEMLVNLMMCHTFIDILYFSCANLSHSDSPQYFHEVTLIFHMYFYCKFN